MDMHSETVDNVYKLIIASPISAFGIMLMSCYSRQGRKGVGKGWRATARGWVRVSRCLANNAVARTKCDPESSGLSLIAFRKQVAMSEG